jgi:small GTP-binding protein
MIQKKVCMMGAYAAGKTSLVARFVKSIFSDKYLTTVGVKVDKKLIQIGERELNLILWDLYGEDEFQKVRLSYLRGSSGYVLVVDGTRRITLDKAILLQKEAEEALGKVPFVLALNKSDLANEWDIDSPTMDELLKREWMVIKTSAKTGLGVQETFLTLARRMLEG